MWTSSSRLSRPVTHEGAPASLLTPEQQLRRLVLACLLWEDQFYVSGHDIAKNIAQAVHAVSGEVVAAVATEARQQHRLRHVPLLLVRELARHPDPAARRLVASTLARVIQRPDELGEFLRLYWQDGSQPLSKQVKRGLAQAFTTFSAYQLAKYDRKSPVKLRDVLFLTHPRPRSAEQAATWQALVDGRLAAPDTWEVALSAGADKAMTFTRLIGEQKLGALALLRNLKGMLNAGVDPEVIRAGLRQADPERVLPFRFLTAARHAPAFEPELEALMLRSLAGQAKLSGRTILLLDASSSMSLPISGRSELTCFDAAAGLAILAREWCQEVEVFTFNDSVVQRPARRGFALRDALGSPCGCTYLGEAVQQMNARPHDRLIVFTDEQSADPVPAPVQRGYLINVASFQNGVGYGPWHHVDGFSEQVMTWIAELETAERPPTLPSPPISCSGDTHA